MIVKVDAFGTDDDTLWNVMRSMRNGFLTASDWTQTLDAPLTEAQRAAWASYRQQLRDAPHTWTPGPEWDAPDPPA